MVSSCAEKGILKNMDTNAKIDDDWIEINQIDEQGKIHQVSMDELKKQTHERYFQFVDDFAKCFGKTFTKTDIEEFGSLAKDPSLFACFDDGLTPERAAEEYLRHHNNLDPWGNPKIV